MPKELKPCPYCGHIPERHDWQSAPDGWSGQVYCTECCMAGPGARGGVESIAAAWNALPRKLRWTREKPTKNGWYWWRTEGDCNLRGIVSVCIETDIMVLAGSYKYLSQTTGEWAGPIPEPEEGNT